MTITSGLAACSKAARRAVALRRVPAGLVPLPAAAFLGAATGLRSQLGIAAVLSRRDLSHLPPPWSLLATRGARVASQLAAGGELIVDKLPTTPPRTKPGPLVGRIVTGAFAGILLDVSRCGGFRAATGVPAGIVAGSAAAAASVIGQAGRDQLSQRVPAPLTAAVEDALAISLALLALRTAARAPAASPRLASDAVRS